MTTYRVWYSHRQVTCHEDFDSHLEALCFSKGLLMLGTGCPLDIRDAQSGEIIDDLSLCVA